MTYLQILSYQERAMNELLCGPWFGMRSDREMLKFNLIMLREQISRLLRHSY